MTDIEIIKSLQGGKVGEYESFLNGNTQEKSTILNMSSMNS